MMDLLTHLLPVAQLPVVQTKPIRQALIEFDRETVASLPFLHALIEVDISFIHRFLGEVEYDYNGYEMLAIQAALPGRDPESRTVLEDRVVWSTTQLKRIQQYVADKIGQATYRIRYQIESRIHGTPDADLLTHLRKILACLCRPVSIRSQADINKVNPSRYTPMSLIQLLRMQPALVFWSLFALLLLLALVMIILLLPAKKLANRSTAQPHSKP